MIERTITIEIDNSVNEAGWHRVVDAVADAENNGEMVEAILDSLSLPEELRDYISVKVI